MKHEIVIVTRGEIPTLLDKVIRGSGYGPSDCGYLSVVPESAEQNDDTFKANYYQTVETPTFTKTGKISKVTHKTIKKTEEYENHIRQLRETLYLVKPNIVVACGDEVLGALCGVSGILSYRGSVLESTLIPGLKVLAMVDPQWIKDKAQWEYIYVSIGDFKKAIAESQYPELKKEEYDAIIAPNFDLCVDYLSRLAASPDTRWSFDIETRAGSIACLGFCVDRTALCIPLQTTTGPFWSAAEESELLSHVGKVFANNPNLVGQNLTYDLDWMLDWGIEAKGVLLDTMIGQFILSPESPKGLDYICSLYTDAVYYKDEGKTWGSTIPDEQLWKYNLKDCFYTLQASYGIQRRLLELDLWKLWQAYGLRLLDVALEIQKRGVLIDIPSQEAARSVILDEYARLRPEVVGAVGYEINVSSPVAVQKFITDMGLPLKKKFKTKKATADEDALMGFLVKDLPKKYQGKVDPQYREKLKLIMKERHLRKAGTYVGVKIKSGGVVEADPLFCDSDGVVRSQLNVAGTKTWRFSMSESPHGTGWNLQTAPKQLRTYKAPPGRIFLQPDQKQAEARVVAWLAQCTKQMELFNDPTRSIHLEFGSKVFQRQLQKDTPEYTAAKSGVHGGNFRMMAERLAKGTGVPVPVCEMAINGYHKEYPEIRFNYHEWVKREIMAKGYLENPFGLRRYFFHAIGGLKVHGKFNNDDWNDACSWIPQSTVPFITNLTLLMVCDILSYVWIHQQGHDAFLISVPVGCEKETSDVIIEQGNSISCNIKGRKLSIPWEMTMGYTWGNMYETYDSFGYQEWRELVEKDIAKGKSGTKEAILKGIYGIL